MTLFQKTSDSVLEHTLLPFIPRWITPNQVSWSRIFALPFIYYCLLTEQYVAGFVLFAIAALTDALDGAMARTRNQITELGKVLDAVADRGLIAVVAIVFIPKFFSMSLLVVIAVLEVVNAGMAYRAKLRLGYNPGANGAGKIKMIVQCVAFGLIFAVLCGAPEVFLTYAYVCILVSLVFTVMQPFMYPKVTRGATHVSV
jgi:phosphatidylglycerophosphate synthase